MDKLNMRMFLFFGVAIKVFEIYVQRCQKRVLSVYYEHQKYSNTI